MRSKKVKRLVVDTSVACAAGGEDATDSVSINCTEFLEVFQDYTQHHVVMTVELLKEWENHWSNYASTWLSHMIASNRLHFVELSQNRTLHDKIEATATREKDINVMLKDFHLLEAALETDKVIISLEKCVFKLFKQAARQVSEIRDIIWVNPDRTVEEQPIVWLKNGAPPEAHRQLAAYPIE